MESYRRALRRWASERRPTPADTVVAVRIPGFAFCLVFDQADFAGCRPYDPAAEVRLSAAASTVEAVVSGRTTGSAASMSGLVALDGDRAALQRVAAVAGGPRFRSYIADISGTSGAGSVGGAGPDVVAVLGAPNDPTGMLSLMAIDRCTTAVGLCRGSPAAGLVLSGGFGAHFNTSGEPHWKHCERWIARRFGAGRARVVGRVESRHTYEDVLLLRELAGLLHPRSVTVVTSDYHVARARFLLDVALPAAAVRGVGHDGLSAGEYERFRQHEHEALTRTVAATLLFGVDRLPAEPAPEHNGGRLVMRLPPR